MTRIPPSKNEPVTRLPTMSAVIEPSLALTVMPTASLVGGIVHRVAGDGDFTHGLIHPEQMIGGRLLVPGSAHATPIAGLYLCGASCHPGPGVTFLPGYGAAYEVAAALGAESAVATRAAA